MKTTDSLKESIRQLEILLAWAEKHAPEAKYLACWNSGSNLYAQMNCYDWDRAEKLEEAAKLFGKIGWFEEVKNEDRNWKKIVGGVEVTINKANCAPPPELRPVMPNEWPLLITETTNQNE